MRRAFIVVLTVLVSACQSKAPPRPSPAAPRTEGVQKIGEFTATVQIERSRPTLAVISGITDAADGQANLNPIDTVEITSTNLTVNAANNAGLCGGQQTLGGAVTLKNYALDELRQVHLEITYAGTGNEACSATFGAPPAGSPAVGTSGIYYYANLDPATATANPLVTQNLTAGQAVQWDFLDPSPGTPFTVRGAVYAERWPAAPVMSNPVQDVFPATPTFDWTSDVSVTKTRLVVYDPTCTTVQNTYDVTSSGSGGGVSHYSQAVAVPQGPGSWACAYLYAIGNPGQPNQFVGTQYEIEVLTNYGPPILIAPADGAINVPSSATFTWTTDPDALGATAYFCPVTATTGADCVAANDAHDVTGDGSGNYTLSMTGLASGAHKWTVVARDYATAPTSMVGAPVPPRTFTVQ